jgi:predicted TIM-barrel fold metal-dependent hydrolase
MSKYSNFYVDISARIGELGRQPYTARRFFLNNTNRILFGSDSGPNLEEYRIAYRFLETDDEYFNYNISNYPKQGRWFVYGINLPDEVLKNIYYENAKSLLLPN